MLDYLEGETEMVVLVTPYIVTPTNPNTLQTPADGFRLANDPDTVLLGRLNQAKGMDFLIAAFRAKAPADAVLPE